MDIIKALFLFWSGSPK